MKKGSRAVAKGWLEAYRGGRVAGEEKQGAMADESVLIQQQLDHEMERLFQHFEQDEERTARLAAALEQESTAAALHFALFPRKTRDGGLQPTCREPVVSMMAFVVDIFSPHDGSAPLPLLRDAVPPAASAPGPCTAERCVPLGGAGAVRSLPSGASVATPARGERRPSAAGI